MPKHNESISCHIRNNSYNVVYETLVLCDNCHHWFHGSCLDLCLEEISSISVSNVKWICPSCVLHRETPDVPESSTVYLQCPLCECHDAKGITHSLTREHPTEPFIDSQKQNSHSSVESFQTLLSTCTTVRVLKRIPKGARTFAADKLTWLIDRCTSENSLEC